MVVHTCNPSSSGGRDLEGLKTPISTNKLGMLAYTYNSHYPGGIGRTIMIGLVPDTNTRPYLKNN
jgi:hypothetical protein